jgi:hypothetical protein
MEAATDSAEDTMAVVTDSVADSIWRQPPPPLHASLDPRQAAVARFTTASPSQRPHSGRSVTVRLTGWMVPFTRQNDRQRGLATWAAKFLPAVASAAASMAEPAGTMALGVVSMAGADSFVASGEVFMAELAANPSPRSVSGGHHVASAAS